MATPSEPFERVASWRRVALVSFFGGLGLAVGIAMLGGVIYWYVDRPKPPQPWNTAAINASYVGARLFNDEKDQTLRAKLIFDLRNNTSTDYTLEEKPSDTTFVMQKIRGKDALVDGMGLTWSVEHGPGSRQLDSNGIPSNFPRDAFIDAPILLPAGQAVRVDFWSEYDLIDLRAASDGDKTPLTDRNEQTKVLKYLLRDTESFVLLDKTDRYRIDLPLGEMAKN
jgi:hypothetical protein